MPSDRRHVVRVLTSMTALLAAAAGAAAQATQRAAFVANNGNIEGSVTSYTFTPDGTPVFVQKFVTGSGSGNPGNNAYGFSISPNGKYLVATHATAASTFEQVTILEVGPDATLNLVGTYLTPDSPLAAQWVTDEYVAITQTKTSGNNHVIMYRFNEVARTLVEVNRQLSGNFTSYLAVHPNRQYLYSSDGNLSGLQKVDAWLVNPNGTLTLINSLPTSPYYVLGHCVSKDGRYLYGGGGISSGSTNILGLDINPLDGSVSWMPGSPFQSPGSSPSPKSVVTSDDTRFAFVGHGSSSMVRSFAVDAHGNLTDTGNAFDVGIQGDLGGTAVLGDLLLFTRKYSSTQYGPTGLLSWTIQPDGSFTPNGTVVGSQGSLPQYIATWAPPVSSCYANCDNSTSAPALNVADFTCYLNRFAALDPWANCDESTSAPTLNVADFTCFLNKFAAGCP